eukprot:1389389-Amphidinium_carterae.1
MRIPSIRRCVLPKVQEKPHPAQDVHRNPCSIPPSCGTTLFTRATAELKDGLSSLFPAASHQIQIQEKDVTEV